MKDMVPKGTGNSRFLRSSIAADITHEELVALLRSGKFPVDFAGLNSAGIQMQGSAYNKANVLPDTVCTRLNIPTSSEPKDAFLALKEKIENEKDDILSRFVVGSYIGNGENDTLTEQFVSLGFTPCAVFAIQKGAGIRRNDWAWNFFAFATTASDNHPFGDSGIYIVTNGFMATWNGVTNNNYGSNVLNQKNVSYHYFAIR